LHEDKKPDSFIFQDCDGMVANGGWTDGLVHDVIVQKLVVHRDDRGMLTELFRNDETAVEPAMGYLSMTRPGEVRGPHEHREQTDVFVFANNFIIYLWDPRKGSHSQGIRQKIITSDENLLQVVVPPGVVHAYQATHPDVNGLCLNFPDQLYRGPGKKQPVDEIRHENDQDTPYVLW
jgi:dTDP-4-dehydrorhamnose 3,5-epimerase